MGKSPRAASSGAHVPIEDELRNRFQHGPDLDLFILTYFSEQFPSPLPPQPMTARLEALIAGVGKAKIQAALDRRSQIRAATRIEASSDGSAGPAGPRVNWARLQPGAPYSPECHIDVQEFEQAALRELRDGLSIILQAPLNQGRSWWQQRLQSLLVRLPDYRCVTINLADWSPESYQSPDRLFPRLQREFLQQLRVNQDELEADRQEARSLSDAWQVIRVWRQRPEVRATKLVLFLDSFDRLMDSRSQNEFFSPLRVLVQGSDVCIILCLSLNAGYAPHRPRRSRLALGRVLKVPDFQPPHVKQLASQYPLPSIRSEDLEHLWRLIGGAPHLNRLAFYQAARHREQPFSALLEEASAVAMGGTLFGEALLNLKELLATPDLRVLLDVHQKGEIAHTVPPATIDDLEHHLGLIVGDSKANRWRLRHPLYLHLLGGESDADPS